MLVWSLQTMFIAVIVILAGSLARTSLMQNNPTLSLAWSCADMRLIQAIHLAGQHCFKCMSWGGDGGKVNPPSVMIGMP
jgi:hypothetical protein